MRYRRLLVALWVFLGAMGCYSYTPLDTSSTIQAGEHVAVEINDRGRAELSDRLGLGVLRLEGKLITTDSVDLVMGVWRVQQIGTPTANWNGESVRFRREYASSIQARTLNRGKTYLVAGGAVAGLIVLSKSLGLLGFATDGSDSNEQPPPVSSRVWW
jgi:hypothetical protein